MESVQWAANISGMCIASTNRLCVTVVSSLPPITHDSESHSSSIHTIEQLLSLMLPTEEEWNLYNGQLTSQVCV